MALTFLRPPTLRKKPQPTERKHWNSGIGLTIPAAAEQLGVTYKMLLTAIELGEVDTVTFAKRRFIKRSEIERLQRLLE
jgi:hypothetical protein